MSEKSHEQISKFFPTIKAPLLNYQDNLDLIKAIEKEVGEWVLGPIIRACLIQVFEPDIFADPADFRTEAELVIVDPNEVGIIEGETYYQFFVRMKAIYDLSTLPRTALPALILNFDPDLFVKPAVVASEFCNNKKIKDGDTVRKFKIKSVFTLEADEMELPEISWIQFFCHKVVNPDRNYIFIRD